MTEFVINKTIRIVTTFSHTTTRASAEEIPVISYELFYPAYQAMPLMTGLLANNNKQDIKCKGSDGFIHGYLLTTVNEEEMVLLGNLFYGVSSNLALQMHFDGTIVIYPLKEHPVPPVPPVPLMPPVPPPGANGSTEDLTSDISIGAPLFPYIDVQPWPTGSTAAQSWQFFNYDPAATPANSLYSLLIPLAVAKDRSGMEALALQFLQNGSAFTGQYFGSLENVHSPFNMFPAIYNILQEASTHHHYEELLLEQTGYESLEQFTASLQQGDYAQVKDQVWQNYFALTIFSGYQENFFIDINKILLIINLVDKLYPPAALTRESAVQHLPSLLRATVILPANIFPLPPYKDVATAVNQIEPYAIGRLKMTRYRLLSYSQGEVAQIENVLKGERKKVVRRSLTHNSEQTVHHTHNTNDQSNLSKETTHELLTEVQKTIAILTRSINYTDLTINYGHPAKAIYNGGWTKTITPTGPSIDDTNSFASTVLNKTISRIRESVLRSRTSHTFSEKEEIQSSLFDNHHGQHNFRGIYRWVNKVYRISLENYGYRFLLQLQMDNPAKDFIASEQVLNNINLQKPLSPQQKKITSFSDINRENYIELLSYYQVTKILLPPEHTITTGIALNQSETEKYISVPPGYMAHTAKVTGQIAAGASLTKITGIIGTKKFFVTNTDNTDVVIEKIYLEQEINQVAVAVNGISITPGLPPANDAGTAPGPPPGPIPEQLRVQLSDFILSATVTCKVSDNKVNEWKIAVYNEIMAAYQQFMQQYNDNITRFAREDQQTNPLLLNNIEKSSLHSNCIAMLLEIYAAKVGQEGVLTPLAQQANQQRYRQFMDEALEWDEMTWRFNDQPAKYSYALQGPDDSLRPFLQATDATVFLPVRPEYNFQLLYYLMTGVLWLSAYPFVPVSSISLDIAMHLKNVPHWHHRRQEEKHWHITLPTAMQVIQEGTQLPDFLTSKYD